MSNEYMIGMTPEEAAKRIKRRAGFLPAHALMPGEICLGVVNDGTLHLGGDDYFKAPCANGKFIVSPFGSESLLLIRLDAESSQLLREASPGIYPFEGPFHIQGCILRPLRIHGQNHKVQETSHE